jgi:hypothetical protein
MTNDGFADIFKHIRTLLLPYSKKMEVRATTATNFHLYIIKDLELAGRQFKECYFSGVKINTTMVSWYFFPYYTHPQKFTIPAAIQKNLKGKNCFNFKKIDQPQLDAIAQLLQEGLALYSKTFGIA